MRVDAMAIEGFRHTHNAQAAEMEAIQPLPAPPVGTSFADALDLVVAALSPSRAPAVLARLQLGDACEITEKAGLVDEVAGLDADGVRTLTDDLPVRRLLIRLSLEPDPPLYRTLRDGASRDPRILTALAGGAQLKLQVGWLFNQAGTHATPGVLSFRVGDVPFPLEDKDRPPWLPGLLGSIASRIHRLDPTASTDELAPAFLEHTLSHDLELRTRAALAMRMAAHAPFNLGQLHLVRHGAGVRMAFGDELVDQRLLGPDALQALRWLHAAVVLAPDVLVAPAPPPGWTKWLNDRIEGEHATLEQVLLVGGS